MNSPINKPIEKNGTGVSDAEVLAQATEYMRVFATHPVSTTPALLAAYRRLKAANDPGACLAHWVDATALQPPPGVLVTVAYLWPGDEEYTVDTAEMDGNQWRYSGGHLMTSEQVHWWCHQPAAPAVPGHAINTSRRRDAVLAA